MSFFLRRDMAASRQKMPDAAKIAGRNLPMPNFAVRRIQNRRSIRQCLEWRCQQFFLSRLPKNSARSLLHMGLDCEAV
jgi:hypothetical protein